MKKFKFTPDKLMIGVFSVIILGISISTLVLPKQERSENENRSLAKFPSLVNESKLEKAENFSDFLSAVNWKYITERKEASFMDDFETYFADHLVGRDLWVEGANAISRLTGKQEINGVYTVDNQMIQSFRKYDEEEVAKSIAAMNKFAERFPEKQMSFMLVPTAQELFKDKLPSYAGLLSEKDFIDKCYSQLQGIAPIDALSYLSEHKNEYLYYRTDHHWTSLGAYYAYSAAAKTLGYGAYGLNSFNIETVSSDFRGTLYSKTLDSSVPADSMDYYTLANGEPKVKLTSTDNGKKTEYNSLYVRDYLKVKDKYSSFTGANAPVVEITTDVDNGKNLLVIKDSYAHALVPFLSKHYSKITMIDMRYVNTGLDSVIDFGKYDQVLFMQNVITFTEDSNLKKLALTK